jgi:hypothetical protein
MASRSALVYTLVNGSANSKSELNLVFAEIEYIGLAGAALPSAFQPLKS